MEEERIKKLSNEIEETEKEITSIDIVMKKLRCVRCDLKGVDERGEVQKVIDFFNDKQLFLKETNEDNLIFLDILYKGVSK